MSGEWTPGAYLARRRRTAGLSLDEVAAEIRTVPYRLNERDRRLWLACIEADIMPIPTDVVEWRQLFPFDPLVLRVLIEIQRDRREVAAPRLCRSCACSQLDFCLDRDDRPCSWVGDEDLCSACALAPLPPVETTQGAFA